MTDLQTFYAQYLAEVIDHFDEHSDSLESAFADFSLLDLESAGQCESPMPAFYRAGPPTRQIECAGYALSESGRELDLFITHFENQEVIYPIHRRDIQSAFAKLDRFLIQSLNGLSEHLEESSHPREMCESITQSGDLLRKIRFIFVTNGEIRTRTDLHGKTQPHASLDDCIVQFICWDIERFRRYRESGRSDLLEIDLSDQPGGGLPCLWATEEDAEYQACITVLPGQALANIYEQHGARLLELNVRSYLQARGKTNKGILSTLRAEPERFFAYNNGITIVAAEADVEQIDDNICRIVRLSGFQIVNGGQTTASLHRASINPELRHNLPQVAVQAKVTILGEEHYRDLVPSISKYANTQNKVSDADLESNEPYNVGVERVSKREWTPGMSSQWFFERSRGSYQSERNRQGPTRALANRFDQRFPKAQKVTKEELARYLNSWNGQPDVVSLGAQKNFVRFMSEQGRKASGWEPSKREFQHMIAKAILYREIYRMIRRSDKITKVMLQTTAYTVACIAEKTSFRLDLDKIWNNQEIGPVCREMAREWSEEIFEEILAEASYRGALDSEYCKKRECWDHIRNRTFRVPKELSTELVGGTPVGIGNSEQLQQERVTSLNGPEWRRIVDWQRHDETVSDRDKKLARKLEELAFDGWDTMPSSMETKNACSILDRVPRDVYRTPG